MTGAAQPIVRRSRVSLAGRVVAANGDPANGARLMLIRTTVTDDHVPAPREDIGRYTDVRGDGLYFFLDMPPGDYQLYWFDDRCQPVLQQSVAIAPGTGPRRFPIVDVDLRVARKRRVREGELAPRPAAPGQRRSLRGAARRDQNA